VTLLLTSDSSRRKALLEQVGFREFLDFEMVGLPLDFPYHHKAERLTLAQVKEQVVEAAGLQVSRAFEERALQERGLSPSQAVLVGAETILFHDGRVLERPMAGEPREARPEAIEQAQERARSMLQAFRGQEIVVITGLVVTQGDRPANQRATCVLTRVKMKPYQVEDIECYITSGEGLGLAGGVDFQKQGIALCEKIKGSFSNIGGLPLLELMDLLGDPLFAGRIHFRLSEPDRGKYSVAVQEGPAQLRIMSLDKPPLELNPEWPDMAQVDVLHVPGSLLIDEARREISLAIMARAKGAGKLVVLDDGREVEKAMGRRATIDLARFHVDVLLEKRITGQRLAQMMSPRLLLASQSPRRRELLKQIVAGNMIEVLVSRQAEPYLAEAPEARVKRLALQKARSVLARKDAYSPSIEIVIGADTEVVLDGQALGKPAGEEEARQQLQRLQGRSHQVITGLALISAETGREFVDSVSTLVSFKALTGAEIETYITSGEPFGKAGAYGIQSKGALFVAEIDGSYSNVVGLPLERLSEILGREFGRPVWQLTALAGRRDATGSGDNKRRCSSTLV
jgi:septum formation protein